MINANKHSQFLPVEECSDIINSYSALEWSPLLNLIPLIENENKFGEIGGGEMDENGFRQMPYWKEIDIVSEFRHIVYQIPIMINFDWGSWFEGREISADDNFDYNTIDIPTKCKLITGIVRSDRFCDGALISAFKSGLILKILKSIKNQLELKNS